MPLLSICIPTYNRCAALKASLEVMTSDPAFLNHDDIEIVISDNASPDDTEKVCRAFAERFPQKIVYHRQPENKGYSANLETLTQIARGEYLKFQNDNMLFRVGAIEILYNFVRRYVGSKPVLFCADRFAAEKESGVVECPTFDSFLENVSHCSTWLGAYGFWRIDREDVMRVHFKYADSLIPQTAVLFDLFDQKGMAAVLQDSIYSAWNDGTIKKSGYNVAKVFSQNYLAILKKYVAPDKISRSCYEYEKKKVFTNWTFPKYFDFLHQYSFEKGHYFKYTKDYHWNYYYWEAFLFCLMCKMASGMPACIRNFALGIYRPIRQWKINRRRSRA